MSDDKKFGTQWRALRSFMTKKGPGLGPSASVMRYNPFQTVRQRVTAIIDATTPETSTSPVLYEVVDYECEGVEAKGVVRRREGIVNTADLVVAKRDAVDNTGSFHWPTEEALAYHLLRSRSLWATAGTLLEIGAGSGVTGFLVNAACAPSQRVVLSDGNAGVVATLQRAVDALPDADRRASLSVAHVLWHDPASYADLRPDVVIGSDCFFFDAYHEQLADMLCAFRARTPTLRVVMMAPRRGTTLERFVAVIRARGVFTSVDVVERHDEYMWSVHTQQMASVAENPSHKYCADKNYPLVVTMC